MKKSISLLMSCAMFATMAGCSSQGSTSGIYTPGTYTASDKGMGELSVSVKVDANKITEVTMDLANETESIGQAAEETLVKEILEKQSAEIDVVAGATITSQAVIRAVSNCLDQAKGTSGNSEKTAVKDGVYTTSAEGYGFTGMMTGDVTFKDNKITDIKITEESDSATSQWFSVAEEKLIPRIIENQSLATDAVCGATISSNAIKNIVSQAIEEAGGEIAEWHTAITKSTETVKLDGYDVIVVGLGGSGIYSYCSAADNGATVFGLEAAGEIGGDSVSTYGPMALNSEVMKEKYNDGEDYINADDVYNTWIEYVGTEEKADVIKEAVYQSGTALDYYVNNFDFSFDGLGGMLGSFAVPEWTKEWTVYTADENNTKWYVLGPDHTFLFKNALNKAKGMNEKNDYQLELTADKLIMDKDGNVTGVHAVSYDGTQYEISGKSVILATGGFIGNTDMMNEYLTTTVNTVGCTVNKGTGIQMGQSAGGALYGMGTLPMIHISNVPNIIRNDDLTADQKAVLSALALTTDMPMITTDGKTWGNENKSGTQDEGITVEIVFAPEYKYMVLYTQDDIDAIKTSGLSEVQAKATVPFIGNGGTLPEAGTPVEDIDKILSVGEDYGNILKANSIKELAEKIGCDEKTLSETLGGEDKTYYAAICQGYAYATVGGLDVDANMNVLKEDGTAISNLFAVGQDSEGVANKDGAAYSPWGGQAQSWTLVSGKIAGEQAASIAKN